ncbi:MAG: hypothetical protein ABIK47_04905 [candidate division WOR-3 bacterium]
MALSTIPGITVRNAALQTLLMAISIIVSDTTIRSATKALR